MHVKYLNSHDLIKCFERKTVGEFPTEKFINQKEMVTTRNTYRGKERE